MDVNTIDITQNELEKIILSNKHVTEYHHLHIHKPNSKLNFISFHIILDDEDISLKESESITNDIKEELEKFGFNHILIQVDSYNCKKMYHGCII